MSYVPTFDRGTRELPDLFLQALLMIDEVHLLREKRGSVLEVVVARMKAIDATVRFVALSATVPNVADVGRWLRPPSTSESSWQDEEADIGRIPSATVFTVRLPRSLLFLQRED